VPASHDFFIAAASAEAHDLVAGCFRSRGWRVADLPGFGIEVARGSAVLTRLLGAAAWRAFHVPLRVELFGTEDGSSVARLHRSLGRSVLRGGATAAAHAERAFSDAADTLHEALERAGVLTGRVANALPAT
jgi:hypothetical protein